MILSEITCLTFCIECLSTTDCTTDALDADSDDVDDLDDSGDELTDAERTLDILHDQCHVMLKGLQCHLELLFQHFEYKPLK